MEPESAVANDTNSAWLLWCGVPAAALLLSLARTTLWLTMPAASDQRAIGWVTVGVIAVTCTLKPANNFRNFLARCAASQAVLIIACSAGDENFGKVVVASAIVLVSQATMTMVQRHAPKLLLGTRAIAIVTFAIWSTS